MLKPNSPAELVMFSTVLIEVEGRDFTGVGTGFVYRQPVGDKDAYVLVTNSHVVEDATTCRVKFHVGRREDDVVTPTGRTMTVAIPCTDTTWRHHPKEDLSIMPLAGLLTKYWNTETPIYCNSFLPDYIQDNEQLEELSAVEEILMVGYPRGIVDRVNYLPVFRRGITATHPAIDFEGNPRGLIDAACLWGSSGSPVFMLMHGARPDKGGGLRLRATPTVVFLGILYGGPVIEADGQVEVVAIEDLPPTLIPIQLGYYVKARVLRDFVGSVANPDPT